MAGNKLISIFTRAQALLPAAVMALGFLSTPAWAFNFEDVATQAKTLAASPYKKPKGELPKSLQDLTYDQYRDIRFNQDHALWAGDDRLALRLTNAVNADIVQLASTASNHLTRLTTQARARELAG